ncbi:MAG: AI-2E family transporter [Enterocloster asparagiformis]|nr:AI-2E family transporter [Enterocloster asparagiformis]
MKNPRFKGYIYWGVTALAVIACSVAFVFFLLEFRMVAAAAGKIVSVLMPIIYGAVLAYLMLPVYNKTRRYITESMSVKVKNERVVQGAAKGVGTLVSLLLLIAIVVGLCWMILPQIYTSILGLQESFSENINNLSIWLQKQLKDNEALEQMVVPVYEQITDKLETWLYDTLVPNMSMVINILSSGLLGVVTVLKNSLIGLIVMVYFLNIKDTFSAQSKKIVYSLFPLKQANRIIEEVRFTHSVFGGFITGKLLDSLIIGVLCFFCLRLLRMPYVLLISVIIGVTNVIPFFGPFIGAIPSAFLILLVSPMKCLYFLLFVLVLQQFDGNILGPKILGDSTGLPSFWVLFSILLFGGLLGFVGMVIAVPTFAVIYHLTSEYVNRCLEKKSLSQRTDDYRDLDYIDEAGNEYIERKD